MDRHYTTISALHKTMKQGTIGKFFDVGIKNFDHIHATPTHPVMGRVLTTMDATYNNKFI